MPVFDKGKLQLVNFFIVEDDNIIRDGLSSFIDWDSIGAKLIGSASNGLEGMNSILDLNPDAVITDVVMPKMDGLEMVMELRKKGWNGDVIFLSSYQEVDYLKRAIRCKAVDYIFKPIENQELLAVISQVADRIRKKLEDGDAIDEPSEIPGEGSFLECLEDSISQNIKTISINTLAARMHMSRSSLIRTVKKISGQTVNEIIIEVRIRNACKLLKETNMHIQTIMEMVGYRDMKYFNVLFKERLNCSPSQYRRKI